MAGPKKTSWLTDVLSSFLAVLLLLASVFAPRKATDYLPTKPSASRLLAELTALSQKIAAHALRSRIGEVVTQARTLLNYLQTQPDRVAPWRDYVRDCLTCAVEGARQFAALSPHLTDPADPAVVKFGDFLAAITQVLNGVSVRVAGEDGSRTGSQIDVHDSTLSDIRRIYLGARETH